LLFNQTDRSYGSRRVVTRQILPAYGVRRSAEAVSDDNEGSTVKAIGYLMASASQASVLHRAGAPEDRQFVATELSVR
jgi:hypothetical protein